LLSDFKLEYWFEAEEFICDKCQPQRIFKNKPALQKHNCDYHPKDQSKHHAIRHSFRLTVVANMKNIIAPISLTMSRKSKKSKRKGQTKEVISDEENESEIGMIMKISIKMMIMIKKKRKASNLMMKKIGF